MSDEILPLRLYSALVRDAVLQLPENTIRSRRILYEKILEEWSARLQSSLEDNPQDMDLEMRLLHYTVRYTERDVRVGVDIGGQGYIPSGLEAARERLFSNREKTSRRQVLTDRLDAWRRGIWDGTQSLEAQQGDRRSARSVHESLLALDGSCPPRNPSTLPVRISIIRALTIHRLQSLVATSQFAYLWMILEIVLLGSGLMLIHSLLGWRHVLNMDVPTFAATGVASWIMIHRTIRDFYQGMLNSRYLINFPVVTPTYSAISEVVVSLPIYFLAAVLILSVGYGINFTVLPDRPVEVVFVWLLLWLCACGIGFVFGTIMVYWPFFRRISPLLQRVLALFSSLGFVSEQLPEDLKPFILWNPLAHGMQWLREEYFSGYVSTDCRPAYFVSCIGVFWLVGIGFQKLARQRIEPA